MHRILIKNATLVNEGIIAKSDVLIENDRIAQIAESISVKSADTKVIDADGLHWPMGRLIAQGQRPPLGDRLLAVSAHSVADLDAAIHYGADFAVLSPVAVTPTHPGAPALGWDKWADIRGDHALPVYALGGLGTDDLATARAHNAQGVAAIRAFWQ